MGGESTDAIETEEGQEAMQIDQVRPSSAVVERLNEYRKGRDAAFREVQMLNDEATILRIEADARDTQAMHILAELEEGGQEAEEEKRRLFGG